jgi:hypothetical protein
MSDDFFKTTALMTSPNFSKGATKVFNLYGKLDEYDYQNDADRVALETDWKNVGTSICISTSKYDKERVQDKLAKIDQHSSPKD